MLTKILFLLFLGACTCEDVARTYRDTLASVDKVGEVLNVVVLSMKYDLPLLNDSRRHYAELFSVLYEVANGLSKCSSDPYYEFYQKQVNVTAAQALSNPEEVIVGTQKLINEYDSKTNQIQALIRRQCGSGVGDCNKVIDKEIDATPPHSELRRQLNLLKDAGRAAEAAQDKFPEFEEASNELNALQYILNGAGKLEIVVGKLVEFLRTLRNINCD